MNKYNIGQTLYYFKYEGSQPDLQSFEVGCIKQTKDSYKYGTGEQRCLFRDESICFESIELAVESACTVLTKFLIRG